MEGQERNYPTNSQIDIASLSENEFGVSDIKTIEQSELQSFLMNDPITSNTDEDQTIEKVVPKSKQDQPKSQAKSQTKHQEEEDEVTEEAVDDFLVDDDLPKTKQDNPKDKTSDQEDEKADSKDDKDDEPIFTTLVRDLKKAGIFTDEDTDDQISDASSFKDKFVREMHKGANSILSQYLSQHGPEYQDAFEAIFVSGMDPATYFHQQERISNLESVDLTKESNQEQILRAYYKAQQYSDEKIDSKIQRFKDMGSLEDEAQDAHEALLKTEKQREEDEREFAEQQAEIRAQNKHNYRVAMQSLINDKLKSKSLDGIPLNPSVATKVYKDLTEDAYRVGNSLITEFDKRIMDLSRPENFEKKLKLALLLQNDLDLSTVKREAIKNEKDDLFQGLERKKVKKQIPSSTQLKSFFS